MRRWPLLAAIAYVVLLFAGLFALPAAPEVNASGARLVRFYRDHGDGIRVVTWLSTVSMVPIVLLVSHVRSRLTGMGRDVMLFGAVGLVVPTTVWSWFNAGLALHASTLDPRVARTVVDVSLYFGPVLTVSIVLLIAPVGLAAWRGEGGFPRWLVWITALFALEQSIETITVLGKRGFIAPGGPMNSMLGAGLFAVWVIAAGAAAAGSTGPPQST
jgi:type IV secretory pathway VirB2 component (pilin)